MNFCKNRVKCTTIPKATQYYSINAKTPAALQVQLFVISQAIK